VTEFNTNGTLVLKQVNGALGVSTNVFITRFNVRIASNVIPSDGSPFVWHTSPASAVVNSFGNALDIPAAAGSRDVVTIQT